MHAAMGLDLHNLYHQPKGEEKKTKEPRKMVVLDVGGERFSAMRATLLRWNHSQTLHAASKIHVITLCIGNLMVESLSTSKILR